LFLAARAKAFLYIRNFFNNLKNIVAMIRLRFLYNVGFIGCAHRDSCCGGWRRWSC